MPSEIGAFVRRACVAAIAAAGCGGLTTLDASTQDACVYAPADVADTKPLVDAASAEEDVVPVADAATCATTNSSAYVAQVTLGAGRTCARMSDGTVQCWGASPVGDGTSSARTKPVQVPCLVDIVDISAGGRHVCAVRSDGAILCWGDNQFDVVTGIGSVGLDVLTPKVVVGLRGFVQVAAGANHTCARRGDGTVSCWGDDLNGPLGAVYDSHFVPPDVPIVGVAKVVAGMQHTCALLEAGTVTCWGADSHHQRGDSTYTFGHAQSVTAGVSGVVDVAAHLGDHTCAIVNGDAVCWGFDFEGQIGDGTTAYTKPATSVIGGASIQQISAGSTSTCGVWSDGSVQCWGGGDYAVLGDGFTSHAAPSMVPGLSGAIEVEVGFRHACALMSDHSLWCWGDNSLGELGDGTTVTRSTPAVVTF